MARYYERHIQIALDAGWGFILETPTWRANRDWGEKRGYSWEQLYAANQKSVRFIAALREAYETRQTRIVISGNIGPRGDGYNPAELMTPDEAADYHRDQIEAFAEAGADLITTLTMTHVGEAVGITRAAQAAGMPVVISFTTETDGRIPTTQTLGNAIQEVDRMTGNGPAYYMVNCAHPTHFDDALQTDETWIKRLRGIRANASTKSHEELDNATELDEGNPAELGAQYRAIRDRKPHVTILGGCCGTDTGMWRKSVQPADWRRSGRRAANRPAALPFFMRLQRRIGPASLRRDRCQDPGPPAHRCCRTRCPAGWSPPCRPP